MSKGTRHYTHYTCIVEEVEAPGQGKVLLGAGSTYCQSSRA